MKIFVVFVYVLLSCGVGSSFVLLSEKNVPFVVNLLLQMVAIGWFVWFTVATSEALYQIYKS